MIFSILLLASLWSDAFGVREYRITIPSHPIPSHPEIALSVLHLSVKSVKSVKSVSQRAANTTLHGMLHPTIMYKNLFNLYSV